MLIMGLFVLVPLAWMFRRWLGVLLAGFFWCGALTAQGTPQYVFLSYGGVALVGQLGYWYWRSRRQAARKVKVACAQG